MSTMNLYGDHAGAVTALLYLPVILVVAALAVEGAARAGWEPALRLVDGYRRATGARRLVVLLLAATAAVHLGLVPGHLAEDRVLAGLFALDFVALTAAAATGFQHRLPLWRAAVTVLLLANLAAYAAYLGAGIEAVDAIGIATKAIEVAALVLVIHPGAAFVRTVEGRQAPALTH